MNEKLDLGIIGGTIIKPNGMIKSNLYIRNGKIESITDELLDTRKQIDASDLLVFPGMVDTHVHFMDPGDTSREDFYHGTQGAAMNGVTTVIEHSHGWPIKSVDDLEYKKEHLKRKAIVDYGLMAHVWPDKLNNIPQLWSSGICAFKIFTCTTHGVPGIYGGLLRDTLRKIAEIDGIALVHAEDELFAKWEYDALHQDHRSDNGIIPEWRSRLGEQIAVSAVVLTAKEVCARLVIAHASTAEIIKIIKMLSDTSNIYIETCPQYLFLFENEIFEKGSLRKFTPPARIRTEEEQSEIWQEINDGSVDLISSDHAPSTLNQKQQGSIWDVPFGLPGIDTTFSVMLDAAINGMISLERLVEIYSFSPANIYRLYPRKGHLGIGADADFVIVDPTSQRVIKNDGVFSKAGWTPYEDKRIKGEIVYTYLRGNCLVDKGVCEEKYMGKFIPGPGIK